METINGIASNTGRKMDTIKLLQIFPTEIWVMILENITDNGDKMWASNAAYYFRDFFLPDRIFFLFPSLWEVLIKRPVMEYGGRSKSLKCRLVCQSWNKAIEAFYQQQGSLLFEQPDKSLNCFKFLKEEERLAMETFRAPQQCLSFCHRFAKLRPGVPEATNPFLGRTVTFKLVHEYTEHMLLKSMESGEFLYELSLFDQIRCMLWSRIYDLLRKFGSHIWYCNFEIAADNGLKLIKCLRLMPNLKGLKVSVKGKARQLEQDELCALEYELRTPLTIPKLGYLSTLNISSVLVSALLASNDNIAQLNIKSSL